MRRAIQFIDLSTSLDDALRRSELKASSQTKPGLRAATSQSATAKNEDGTTDDEAIGVDSSEALNRVARQLVDLTKPQLRAAATLRGVAAIEDSAPIDPQELPDAERTSMKPLFVEGERIMFLSGEQGPQMRWRHGIVLPGANGQPHIRKGPGGARLYRIEAVRPRPLPSLGQRSRALLAAYQQQDAGAMVLRGNGSGGGQQLQPRGGGHGRGDTAAASNYLVFGRPSTPEMARRPPTRMRRALPAPANAESTTGGGDLKHFEATPSLLEDLRATAKGKAGRKMVGEVRKSSGGNRWGGGNFAGLGLGGGRDQEKGPMLGLQQSSLAATGDDSLASSLRLDGGPSSEFGGSVVGYGSHVGAGQGGGYSLGDGGSDWGERDGGAGLEAPQAVGASFQVHRRGDWGDENSGSTGQATRAVGATDRAEASSAATAAGLQDGAVDGHSEAGIALYQGPDALVSEQAAGLGYKADEGGRDGGIGLGRGGVYGDDVQVDAPVTRLGLGRHEPADTGVLLAAARRRRLDRYWTTAPSQHAGKGGILATRVIDHGFDAPGGSMLARGADFEAAAVSGHAALRSDRGGAPGRLADHAAVGHGVGLGVRLGIGEGRTGALAEGAMVGLGRSGTGGGGRIEGEAAPRGVSQAAALTVQGSEGAPVDPRNKLTSVQLVREELMMGEQEYNKLQRRSIVVRMYTSWLRRGISAWKKYTMRVRAVERALVSCMRIQRAWRQYWAGVEADALRMCRDEGCKMAERREGMRLRDGAEAVDERLRPIPPWDAEDEMAGSDSDSESSFVSDGGEEGRAGAPRGGIGPAELSAVHADRDLGIVRSIGRLVGLSRLRSRRREGARRLQDVLLKGPLQRLMLQPALRRWSQAAGLSPRHRDAVGARTTGGGLEQWSGSVRQRQELVGSQSMWDQSKQEVLAAKRRRRRRPSLALAGYAGPLKPMQRGIELRESKIVEGKGTPILRGRRIEADAHRHRGWSAPPRSDAGSQLLIERQGTLPVLQHAGEWVAQEVEGCVRGVLSRSTAEIDQRARAGANRVPSGKVLPASRQLRSMLRAVVAWRTHQTQGAATDDGITDLSEASGIAVARGSSDGHHGDGETLFAPGHDSTAPKTFARGRRLSDIASGAVRAATGASMQHHASAVEAGSSAASVASSLWTPHMETEVAGTGKALEAMQAAGTADSFGVDVAVVQSSGIRRAWQHARLEAVNRCLSARARTTLALWSTAAGRDVSPLLCAETKGALGLDPDASTTLQANDVPWVDEVTRSLLQECEDGLNGYIETIAESVAAKQADEASRQPQLGGGGGGIEELGRGEEVRGARETRGETNATEASNRAVPSSRDLLRGQDRRSQAVAVLDGATVSVMLVFEALMALLFPGKAFELPPSPDALLKAARAETASIKAGGLDSVGARTGALEGTEPPTRVLRSWLVIARMLELPAPRLAREMKRCVERTLAGDDGHGGTAVAGRVGLLLRYLRHPLWPGRRSTRQGKISSGASSLTPTWLAPGLPREWLRAREFAEWVELAVGLYVLRADPAGLVATAAEGLAGASGESAADALARWEALREAHQGAAEAQEQSWWEPVAMLAASTNPLVLLPRVPLGGWAWMQGRAQQRQLEHYRAVHREQRTAATSVLLSWAGNALPGPRPGGPQGPVFPVLETDQEAMARRADETGRPLMARLSYSRLGAKRIVGVEAGLAFAAAAGDTKHGNRAGLRLWQGDDECGSVDPLLAPARARRPLRCRLSAEIEALVSPSDCIEAYCRTGKLLRAVDITRYFQEVAIEEEVGQRRDAVWKAVGAGGARGGSMGRLQRALGDEFAEVDEGSALETYRGEDDEHRTLRLRDGVEERERSILDEGGEEGADSFMHAPGMGAAGTGADAGMDEEVSLAASRSPDDDAGLALARLTLHDGASSPDGHSLQAVATTLEVQQTLGTRPSDVAEDGWSLRPEAFRAQMQAAREAARLTQALAKQQDEEAARVAVAVARKQGHLEAIETKSGEGPGQGGSFVSAEDVRAGSLQIASTMLRRTEMTEQTEHPWNDSGGTIRGSRRLDPVEATISRALVPLGATSTSGVDLTPQQRVALHRTAARPGMERAVEPGAKGRGMLLPPVATGLIGDPTWHPAVGMRLPRLLPPGASLDASGAREITRHTDWKRFREMSRGSLDTSFWLARPMLQVGPVPVGPSSASRYRGAVTGHTDLQAQLLGVRARGETVVTKEGVPGPSAPVSVLEVAARETAVGALLADGITTFVSLCTEEELDARGGRAEEEARRVVREIRKRRNAFRAREETTYLKIKSRATRASQQGYALKKVLRLQREEAEAAKRWSKVQGLFRSYPAEVHFLQFEIRHGTVPRDAHLLRLCEALEARMRRGERLYLFSGTGRGRASLVAGAIMARLYGSSPRDLLSRLQLASEAPYRQVVRPQRPRPLLAPMVQSDIAATLRAKQTVPSQAEAAGGASMGSDQVVPHSSHRVAPSVSSGVARKVHRAVVAREMPLSPHARRDGASRWGQTALASHSSRMRDDLEALERARRSGGHPGEALASLEGGFPLRVLRTFRTMMQTDPHEQAQGQEQDGASASPSVAKAD